MCPHAVEDVVLMGSEPVPDPYCASFSKRLECAGLSVHIVEDPAGVDLGSLDPATTLVVDVGHPGLTRPLGEGHVTLGEACELLELGQVGSIRHHSVARTVARLDELIAVATSFDDERSRETALALVCDQLVGVPRYLFDVVEPAEAPYVLTELFDHSGEEYVADVGAADGDTFTTFAGLQRPPLEYDAFEIDQIMVNRLRQRVAQHSTATRVSVRDIAVSDEVGERDFVVLPASGASHVRNADADQTLDWVFVQHARLLTTTLDAEYKDRKMSLLKIDIEGHESAALTGGRTTIARDRPILAVAGYHEADDLWRLTTEVRNIVDKYCYFLRKYPFGRFHDETSTGMFFLESVLYAVPVERCTRHRAHTVPDTARRTP